VGMGEDLPSLVEVTVFLLQVGETDEDGRVALLEGRQGLVQHAGLLEVLALHLHGRPGLRGDVVMGVWGGRGTHDPEVRVECHLGGFLEDLAGSLDLPVFPFLMRGQSDAVGEGNVDIP
jgi:hypothetical protein